MHFKKALCFGLIGLSLTTGMAMAAGSASDDPALRDFVGNLAEAMVAIHECDYEWDNEAREAWVKDKARSASYTRDDIEDLIMLGMASALYSASSDWNKDKPNESCREFGRRYGPAGTIRKGVLIGSGKPQ